MEEETEGGDRQTYEHDGDAGGVGEAVEPLRKVHVEISLSFSVFGGTGRSVLKRCLGGHRETIKLHIGKRY
jgi:hypothetical protein